MKSRVGSMAKLIVGCIIGSLTGNALWKVVNSNKESNKTSTK